MDKKITPIVRRLVSSSAAMGVTPPEEITISIPSSARRAFLTETQATACGDGKEAGHVHLLVMPERPSTRRRIVT